MTTAGYICGFIGAALTLASYWMKSMMPLRLVALAASGFFVAYGWLEAALPTLVLYSAMILINSKKAWEIRTLVRAIETAKSDAPPGQNRADAMEEGRCGHRDGLSRVRHAAPGRARRTIGPRISLLAGSTKSSRKWWTH
jgi:hypothetical protein